jgi:outer membrane lipoprotein-sorting protein
MNKLLIVALVLLSGCVAVDAYNIARFDNIEYMQINTIHTVAQLGAEKCGTESVLSIVNNLYVSSVVLNNYSTNLPNNKDTVIMTGELASLTKELNARYSGTESVSVAYCTLKFKTIEKNALTMQKVIGDKPR